MKYKEKNLKMKKNRSGKQTTFLSTSSISIISH